MVGGKVLGVGSKLAQVFSEVRIEYTGTREVSKEILEKAKEAARKLLTAKANEIALALLSEAIVYAAKDDDIRAKTAIKAIEGLIESIDIPTWVDVEKFEKIEEQGWEPNDISVGITIDGDVFKVVFSTPNGVTTYVRVFTVSDRNLNKEQYMKIVDELEVMKDTASPIKAEINALKEEVKQLQEKLDECRERLERCDCPEEEEEDDDYEDEY
ncbi:MAG: hypothetical protein ABGW50_01585 [Thermococcus sp.]